MGDVTLDRLLYQFLRKGDISFAKFKDNAALSFGDAKDVGIKWNGSVLQILPLVDDTGAINFGSGTYDMDVKVFLGTAAKYVLFDVGNVLLQLEDVDLLLGDNDELRFGDGSGGDVVFKWDATNLTIKPRADDTGAIIIGDGTTDMDLKVFLGTTGEYALFDMGNSCLSLVGIPFFMGDDQLLTIGTTVATAETKITMEFDETTTGIGLFNMGDLSVPMVLNTNPGATVCAHTINILQSAGAGDCADLLGSYVKVAFSGDGDNGTTAVAGAFRAYAGTAGGSTTVVSQLYGIQPWVSHFGTGAVTAMSALSAKCDVNTGNFTASTVNAGHFHIEGASTVTAQFDGVMIEVYPDVTCLDSMLALAVDSGAVVDAAIRLSGAVANDFLNFAATGTCGIVTADPSVGAANAWIRCHVGSTIFWLIGYADA